MNKEKIVFVIGVISILMSSIISVYAANYLYSSNEVSYDNSVSGIQSDNVQGAMDELYAQATNYENVTNTLNKYFQESSTISKLNLGKNDTSKYGQIELFRNNVSRSIIWATDAGVSIGTRDSAGTTSVNNGGTIDLRGSSIKFNGTDVTALTGTGTRLFNKGEDISLANSTYKTVAQVNLTPGVWILFGVVRYDDNTSGRRYTILSKSTDSADGMSLLGADNRDAVSGGKTYCHVYEAYSAPSNETIYLNAWQNSGNNLTTAGRLYAIKIK